MSKEGSLVPIRTKISLVHTDEETYMKVALPKGVIKPKHMPKHAIFINDEFVEIEIDESAEDQELV
jgi:hypothetical protein